MNKILEMLFDGDLYPQCYLGKNNMQMKEVAPMISRNAVKLEETLNDIQKDIFEKYVDAVNEYHHLSERQCFCDGYSLAVKMMMESIQNVDQIT